MAQIINTGNETVDKLGEMNLTGNVIPMNWYRTILRDNERPYLLAICILSEICYWHRPTEIRDEHSGLVIGYRKRFKGDKLQKTYQQFADMFGESKRAVKAAMDKLEDMRIIKRDFKKQKLSNGMVLNNVLFITLNPDVLREVTFNIVDKDDKSDEDGLYMDELCGDVSQNNVGAPAKSAPVLVQEKESTSTQESNRHANKLLQYPTEKGDTNTENTIYNTKENMSYHSISIGNQKQEMARSSSGIDVIDDMNLTRMLIKDNINYDYLISDSRYHIKDQLDELIELMVEVCVLPEDVVIGDKTIPHALIQSRFEKYDMNTMEYVLESLRHTTSHITNYRNYVLTTLFNAPLTTNNRMSLVINHDLYGND